jgi:adenine C2-methylase RlmN of 23S rRNA A2503 and tRNA A37
VGRVGGKEGGREMLGLNSKPPNKWKTRNFSHLTRKSFFREMDYGQGVLLKTVLTVNRSNNRVFVCVSGMVGCFG